MRLLFALALISFGLQSAAQDAHMKVTFSDVVACDGVTWEALYSQAQEWMFTSYNNFEKTLQLDKEGRVIGKASFKYSGKNKKAEGVITYTVKITVLDGKYRYEASNFTHISERTSFGLITKTSSPPRSVGEHNWCYREWIEMHDQVKGFVKNMTVDLKREISDNLKK